MWLVSCEPRPPNRREIIGGDALAKASGCPGPRPTWAPRAAWPPSRTCPGFLARRVPARPPASDPLRAEVERFAARVLARRLQTLWAGESRLPRVAGLWDDQGRVPRHEESRSRASMGSGTSTSGAGGAKSLAGPTPRTIALLSTGTKAPTSSRSRSAAAWRFGSKSQARAALLAAQARSRGPRVASRPQPNARLTIDARLGFCRVGRL
jgi:hypothetical protein